jgi:ectoine hydroxylase-related dioxygenase (phytanoyl-CoA dioxygenase family)
MATNRLDEGPDGPSSPSWFAALPTTDDVAFYDEHGYWVSGSILPGALLDEAALAAERFYRGERDARLPFAEGYSNWSPANGLDVVRNNEFVSLQSHGLARLARQPVIGAIAGRLARTSQIRLLDDQLVYKPPGTADRGAGPPRGTSSDATAVGWHADLAYWKTCSSERLLTAWIPFHDIDEERGTLVVLDGSHRWAGTGDTRFFNDPDLDATERRLARDGRAVVRVPMRLRRGQVSFHHGWTLHASYPNSSPSPRLALAVHLQDQDNHYRPSRGPNGEPVHMFDERLCRRLPNGDPDFADPSVMPVIWPSG